MLREMLEIALREGIVEVGELSRELGVSRGLIELALAHLRDMGLLRPLGPACPRDCPGCGRGPPGPARSYLVVAVRHKKKETQAP